jgi:hypothetical protein
MGKLYAIAARFAGLPCEAVVSFRHPPQEADMSERDTRSERKEYFPPKIIHTEKIETRAVVCAMADDATCSSGPIQS